MNGVSAFNQYWTGRGINPACIPATISGNHVEYQSRLNGKSEKFQWTKTIPFPLDGEEKNAFFRANFSAKRYPCIPLFVSAKCDYSQGNSCYLVEGLSDCFSLLSNNIPAIACRDKGSLQRAEAELRAFLSKYPNITDLRIIPDPDGWTLWTAQAFVFTLPVTVSFLRIETAFERASVAADKMDVNALWQAVHRKKDRFFDALRQAITPVDPPVVSARTIPTKPAPQTCKSKVDTIDAIETAYTGEILSQFALIHAPKPSKGLLDHGDNKREIRSNGGFYINLATKEWYIHGKNVGAIGAVTLASWLLYRAKSVKGEQFKHVMAELAAFIGADLPFKPSAAHPPEPPSPKSEFESVTNATPAAEPAPKNTTPAEAVVTKNAPKAKKQKSVFQGKVAPLAAFLQSRHTFGYNELESCPYVDGEQLSDDIDALLHCECRGAGFKGKELMSDVILTLARQRPYHPIKQFLESTPYDGQPHISHLNTYVKDSKDMFSVVLRKWMIQAVRKVYTGSQNEVLVFVGGQGIGKSLLVSWLCPPALRAYFVECGQIDPDNKDHQIMHATNFFGEVGELGATTKSKEVRALKDYFTKQTITFRPPYGKRSMKKTACMSFIGTENEDGSGFLKDLTGNRRYIPIEIESIAWAYREQCDPAQMWAEAYAAYKAGESTELTKAQKDTLAGIAEEHLQTSVELEYLQHYFDFTQNDDDWLYALDILATLQQHGYNEREGTAKYKIAQELKKLGVKRVRGRRGTEYSGIKKNPEFLAKPIQPPKPAPETESNEDDWTRR